MTPAEQVGQAAMSAIAQKEAEIEALAIPTDTTAISAIIAKAGEVMRERCVAYLSHYGEVSQRRGDEIRALPGVTMEDLQNG